MPRVRDHEARGDLARLLPHVRRITRRNQRDDGWKELASESHRTPTRQPDLNEMKTNELPPQIPTVISSDGSEIWKWAADLGSFLHRRDQRIELRKRIADCTKTCGSCTLWMTSKCPRETPRNGRNHGPSMNGPTCTLFSQNESSKSLQAQWEKELAALEEAK